MTKKLDAKQLSKSRRELQEKLIAAVCQIANQSAIIRDLRRDRDELSPRIPRGNWVYSRQIESILADSKLSSVQALEMIRTFMKFDSVKAPSTFMSHCSGAAVPASSVFMDGEKA